MDLEREKFLENLVNAMSPSGFEEEDASRTDGSEATWVHGW